MSETTPVSGLVIAEDLDILNTEAAFGQLANSIDTYCIPRFTTTALRDAAITAPVEGMLCMLGNTLPALMRHSGSAWVYAEEKQFGLMTSNVTHSTTTPANLPGMALTLEGNAVYAVETIVTIDGNVDASAVDYLITFTYSGTLTQNPTVYAVTSSVASTTPNTKNVGMAAGTTLTFTVGASSAPEPMLLKWIFTTTTSGTLQWQGRQGTAGAETIQTTAASSWCNARRIG